MLRYVLLFGDVDMITPYDTSVEPWGAPQPPDFWGNNITDYYYSTEKDPTSSTNYLLPWLSIGRIPVRTAAQGMDVVDQIISYEKLPPTDSDYYDRMVFAGYFQDHEWWESPASADGRACRAYMKTMEEIRSHMITLGYDVERVYVSQYTNVKEYVDGTPVPADVVASIVDPATATNMLLDATTDGQLIVGHRDHGDIDGWSHPPFNTGHLGSVTGDMPTIFYSVNCLTGQFDLTAPTESFAEHILRMKGAAPSLIAATRVSHSWLNNDMIKALFDAMWGGVLPTFPGSTASYPVKRNRLGDILNYAKAYLPVAMSGSAEYIKDHYEIYHVVGDPTLELWKSEPLRIKIRALIRQGYLDISLSSCPKYSVITVWWKDKLIKKISPSSTHMKIALKGIVELPLPWRPIRPPIFVCFWAPGYRFCQVIPRMEIRPITAIPVKAKKVRP